VRQAQVDAGQRSDVSSDESAQLKRLRWDVGILPHTGWTNIAKVLRHNARDAYRTLAVLGINAT
jgi:hypothetical protein